MPDNNISKAQPSKAKGLGGVLTIRSKNAALLYMYRLTPQWHFMCYTCNTFRIYRHDSTYQASYKPKSAAGHMA